VDRMRWVFLAYRMPREPSTPRIAVWRKLRQFGAAQIVDGLVALPLDARTREQLEWLADDISAAGGEASMWIAQAATASMERNLAAQMAVTIAADYGLVRDEAVAVAAGAGVDRRRTVARLRRELRRIRARDFFPPPDAEEARSAVEALAAVSEESFR
jgi:hypothetical protein